MLNIKNNKKAQEKKNVVKRNISPYANIGTHITAVLEIL